jgi:D-alanyl-D-alanine carboxypeptidase
VLAVATHAALAPAWAQVIGRHAALVIDANTGRVIHQSSADDPRHPASLAKLMTLYLVFELIEQGRLTYATRIRFSANAAAAPPSKLDVEEGAEISLIDAIKALITKSCNDVAVALAEHIAGSEMRFAQMMTQKARQLGMKASVFRNASGLPDPEQITTARDMITLALRLHDDFPRHYPLFATRTFTYNGDTFRNHNTMLFSYEGTEGLKTGYTRASGFNLVASVKRGNKHVMGAVFGGATAALRNSAMRTYLNMALMKASTQKTRRPAPRLVAQSRTAPAPAIAVPAPQPAQRPQPQTAGPPVEMARVRPVFVPGAQTATTRPPAGGSPDSIEDLLAASPQPGARNALAGPPPAVQPRPAGAFQIQIGAFQTQAEAERQLASVRQRAGVLLGGRPAVTTQFSQRGKVYYRARFAGFEAQAAASDACGQLKRLSIDCMVMRAD